MKCIRSFTLILFTLVAALAHGSETFKSESSTKNPILLGDAPMVIPGKVGRFDFMEFDGVHHRILAAHKGAGNLVLIDLKTGRVMPPIEVGNVQGVSFASESGIYILGDADEQKVVFVNARTLKKTGELKVDGPVDAIAFDSKNGFAYAGEDDGSHIWVVDVKKQKLVTTIPLSGVPEFVAYDSKTNRIYQNIKTKDTVAVINPETNKVEYEWSTLPATGPHGLAVNTKTGRLFIAGHNGKLVELDIKTGKFISQVEIAPGTDQISVDDSNGIIYCASKGFISAVKETESGLTLLGDTPTMPGAHTLSVDSVRHEVWVSYADKVHSYVQKFKPTSDVARKK